MLKKFDFFPTTFHFYALPISSGPRKKVVKLSFLKSEVEILWQRLCLKYVQLGRF